jgi:nucleoside diphosphate kinase
MISEPIARSVQIMHQSCVQINTISKCTKMSFHLTHVTDPLDATKKTIRGTFGAKSAPNLR